MRLIHEIEFKYKLFLYYKINILEIYDYKEHLKTKEDIFYLKEKVSNFIYLRGRILISFSMKGLHKLHRVPFLKTLQPSTFNYLKTHNLI